MAERNAELAGRVEAVEQKSTNCPHPWISGSTRSMLRSRSSANTPNSPTCGSTGKMDAGFARLDEKMDTGFAWLDAKMDAGFSLADSRSARIERKLDQFFETQSRTNELVERRLRGLEA